MERAVSERAVRVAREPLGYDGPVPAGRSGARRIGAHGGAQHPTAIGWKHAHLQRTLLACPFADAQSRHRRTTSSRRAASRLGSGSGLGLGLYQDENSSLLMRDLSAAFATACPQISSTSNATCCPSTFCASNASRGESSAFSPGCCSPPSVNFFLPATATDVISTPPPEELPAVNEARPAELRRATDERRRPPDVASPASLRIRFSMFGRSM